jgi:hypothetical protein
LNSIRRSDVLFSICSKKCWRQVRHATAYDAVTQALIRDEFMKGLRSEASSSFI